MGLGSYKKVGYSIKAKLTSIHTQAKLKHKNENKRETTFQGKKTFLAPFLVKVIPLFLHTILSYSMIP